MSETPSPKAVKPDLVPMANTIAMENGLFFEYYPVKFGVELGQYVQLTKLPPVLKEGYVTFNKKLYKLTLQDLIRRRLNVGQPSYGTEPTPTEPGKPNTLPKVVRTSSDNIESDTSQLAEIQICQDADMAWTEQVHTLLHTIDPEEEWDYSSLTQSRPVNESSTV
jgi:hypothetical protein